MKAVKKSATKRLAFRITEDEYEKFLDKVAVANCSVSKFIRNAVIENKTQILRQEDALHLFYHVCKIGNNINQIAHRIHIDRQSQIVCDDTYKRVLRELKGNNAKLDALLRLTFIKRSAVLDKNIVPIGSCPSCGSDLEG